MQNMFFFTKLLGILGFLGLISRLLISNHKYKKFVTFLGTVFVLIHFVLGFWSQLGGIRGLSFLPDKYLQAVVLGFFGLVMGFAVSLHQWRYWRKMLYVAIMFTIFHFLIIGSDFSNTSSNSFRLMYIFVSIIFLLEAWVLQKQFKYIFPIMIAIVFGLGGWLFGPNPPINTVSVNGAHMQSMQVAPENVVKSRRYSVNFKQLDNMGANVDTRLGFEVLDAGTGEPVKLFQINYEKLMHLVIVDENLKYFVHIHPEFDSEKGFFITHKFPHEGKYRAYINFLPLGEKMEQQFGFEIQIGKTEIVEVKTWAPDVDTVKKFGDYEVRADVKRSGVMFDISKDGVPVKDLQPYLGAFGHLVMINTQTFEYIHIHPQQMKRVTEGERGGPEVQFMAMGQGGDLNPGIYRVFGQFRPNGNLMVADFTVEVK